MSKMAGMSGGSMLRCRRKDVNVKPNRRLDRKSSRGMLYENEELRLRTININAEVERGQSDIKKLKRENEQLRREVGALRGEYDRLERLLHQRQHQDSPEPENIDDDKESCCEMNCKFEDLEIPTQRISIISCCSDCSIDCCNIHDGGHPEIIICDSSDATQCSKYPACHSLEIREKQTKPDVRQKTVEETGQSYVDVEKNEGNQCCQKDKNTLSDVCQESAACQSLEQKKNSKFNFDEYLKKDSGEKISNKIDCQNENRNGSDVGKFPIFPGCERLSVNSARSSGPLLSPVLEENSSPRSPNLAIETHRCQSYCEIREKKLENMDKPTPGKSDTKEYYKEMTVVTVPVSSHIPNVNTNNYSNAEISRAEADEEGVSVFPKTGLDILINNNCFEQFSGFCNTQPLGFIVPPPLDENNRISAGPFQIVPNVEFTNLIGVGSNNLANNNVSTFGGVSTTNEINVPLNFHSNSNVNPFQLKDMEPKNDVFILTDNGNISPTLNNLNSSCTMPSNPQFLTTVVGSNSISLCPDGRFIATTCQNISTFNDQTNTLLTTNGLCFTSNHPIMSSMECAKLPAMINPSISPTDSFAVSNSLSVTPNCFSTIVPFIAEHENATKDPSISVSDIDSSMSECNEFKDSYFLCKTRKIIQQMTTVQNTHSTTVTSPCGCTCRCNQQLVEPSQNMTSETISAISDTNNRNARFRTEKSIELNYDYPKSFNQSQNEIPGQFDIKENRVPIQEAVTNSNTTQTLHTTTEVNSTLLLVERKKFPFKSKSKFENYKRSNSAPVGIPSDEPVYATVNKLPKKLKRLNIKNLENEIKYVLPDDENKTDEVKKEEDSHNQNSTHDESDGFEGDKQKTQVKSNGDVLIENPIPKSDSFSESSDKNNAGVPKSPGAVRKKKKFSIRFKRKSSKTSANSKPSVESKLGENKGSNGNADKLVLDLIKSIEPEKLMDQSSSPDSPDPKNKIFDSNYCKKHGKPKHSHHHYYESGCESPRCYRKEYSQQRCAVHNKQVSGNPGQKKHLNSSRNYYKQDSYQEMTTSHSERERTNSLSSSGHSGFSLGSKAQSGSQRREGSIPWCGCWGNSCL